MIQFCTTLHEIMSKILLLFSPKKGESGYKDNTNFHSNKILSNFSLYFLYFQFEPHLSRKADAKVECFFVIPNDFSCFLHTNHLKYYLPKKYRTHIEL
jgi:hypothetical protein